MVISRGGQLTAFVFAKPLVASICDKAVTFCTKALRESAQEGEAFPDSRQNGKDPGNRFQFFGPLLSIPEEDSVQGGRWAVFSEERFRPFALKGGEAEPIIAIPIVEEANQIEA